MSLHRKFIAAIVSAFAVLGAALLSTDADWKPAVATFITAVAGAAVVWLVPNG
jgi:hypothetical protein